MNRKIRARVRLAVFNALSRATGKRPEQIQDNDHMGADLKLYNMRRPDDSEKLHGFLNDIESVLKIGSEELNRKYILFFDIKKTPHQSVIKFIDLIINEVEKKEKDYFQSPPATTHMY